MNFADISAIKNRGPETGQVIGARAFAAIFLPVLLNRGPIPWYRLSKLNLGCAVLGPFQIRRRLIFPALLVLVLTAGGQATGSVLLSINTWPQLQAVAACHVPVLSHFRPASRWNAASAPNKRFQPAIVPRNPGVPNQLVGAEVLLTLSTRPLRGAALDQRGRSPPASL